MISDAGFSFNTYETFYMFQAALLSWHVRKKNLQEINVQSRNGWKHPLAVSHNLEKLLAVGVLQQRRARM